MTDYIARQPRPVRHTLILVRRAIRRALPGAEEGISYRVPTYRLHDRAVIYFAAWRRHYSLYPLGDRLVRAFREQLAPYHVGKSTLRFPLTTPVPTRLIEAIAKFRAREVASRVGKRPRTRD